MSSKKVTISVVAEKAGVSKSTVSRVISDSPEISQKTKEKIFAIMEELNYYPSAIARSLVSKKSMNIGLVLPADDNFFINPFFQQSLRSISKKAAENGFDILIVYSSNEIESIKRVVNAKKVDGLILMRSQENDKTIEYLRKKNIDYVLIGKSMEYNDIYSVDNDNVQAAYDVTERLIRCGCKKIGFIAGDDSSVVTIDRYEGYKKAIEDNLSYQSEDLIQETRFSENDGMEAMRYILDHHPDLDGVVITDDLMFRGALEYINSRSDIGNDTSKKIYIAIFGSSKDYLNYKHRDNIKVVSVDVNAMKLGEVSCKKLINLLEDNKVDIRDLVEYKVDVTC